ncbi:MAG: nitronate monooxygenase [Ignavibacteria bacterium]|nr:MAG: nitronate monooxygenase [Ignavibacteria bacterium]
MTTRITELFQIRYPVIQAGMVWVSGWRLAAAVSKAGGLGLIGAGSMKPDLLREHIRKARAATSAPLGVNIPLLRGDSEDLVRATVEEGIRIVFTSAGHPGKYLPLLKDAGCIVAHVVPSLKHAKKVEQVGCDAVVAEGFEAGGHNGFEETTTFCLLPQVADAVSIPVIAAGGIADGRQMAAALALGADGVQIGTLFAAAEESSAHEVFKQQIVEAGDGATVLTMKKIAPVRLIRTPFALRSVEAEARGADPGELRELLGSKREMRGMFEGDLEEGEFEAGQCAALVSDVRPAADIISDLMRQYLQTLERMADGAS